MKKRSQNQTLAELNNNCYSLSREDMFLSNNNTSEAFDALREAAGLCAKELAQYERKLGKYESGNKDISSAFTTTTFMNPTGSSLLQKSTFIQNFKTRSCRLAVKELFAKIQLKNEENDRQTI